MVSDLFLKEGAYVVYLCFIIDPYFPETALNIRINVDKAFHEVEEIYSLVST
jgi:hypothetical protein